MTVTVVEKGHLTLRGKIHLTLDSVKGISTLLHYSKIQNLISYNLETWWIVFGYLSVSIMILLL